eukprot:TRINITY_DN48744_c0_g1_i1.p2 TRINITY_DN48744_c0_g1~~TRINITY_DN48744_c0_g1_i1.p2  ORF type:complete len:166 (+),score=24.74 TRINITY_DN48744_c0_g1_i1:52-549(+)
MDMEHSSYERVSTQQRGNTLESNAHRLAKTAARMGVHISNPAGTMQQMFDTFVGKELSRRSNDSVASIEHSAKQGKKKRKRDSSSSSSSSDDRKKKSKKKKKTKREKASKADDKALARWRESQTATTSRKRKREDAIPTDLQNMDPKFASIIGRFRRPICLAASK